VRRVDRVWRLVIGAACAMNGSAIAPAGEQPIYPPECQKVMVSELRAEGFFEVHTDGPEA
jgi:hypothetical protein